MDVSVVIVSYNTRELLARCLKSLEKSLVVLKAEVIVCDNASSDQTADMVKKDFPWVRLTENKRNLGFSRANNIAIKKAQGKYILILNPDTEVKVDTIKKMYGFMKKRPEVGIATCKVELLNGELDRDCRRHFPSPWRSFTHFSGLSKIFKGSKIFDQYWMGYLSETSEHEIDSCVGAFMFIRKKDLDRVGLFDKDFFFYGEDLDLCWRFKELGYKVVYTPITKILHHKGAASGMKPTSQYLTKATRESKKKALAESVRAMELFYKKHYQKIYPLPVNWLILFSLKILRVIRIRRA